MTHVAYLKRIVAGARRMWLKTEAMVPPTSLPWSPGMSDARSCRKRKNQTLLVSKEYGVLRKLKHIFPNTYQRIKSICSPAKGGTGCYRFNYQPGS